MFSFIHFYIGPDSLDGESDTQICIASKILHKYIWLINCEQFKEHVYSGYHMYNVCYDIGWYIWVLYLIMNGRVYILIITEWKCSYVVKYKR